MSDPTLDAAMDAANAYEALFVPSLFGQWAPKVADAARLRPGHRALDVACGTGVLAREVARRVGSSGHVAAVDPDPGMIAVARQLDPAVEWHEGVAERLPFAGASFDAVVSQFGLMFFGDRHRALREMMRVLVPGGHLAVAVWDSLDRTPAFAAEVALPQEGAGRRAADALRAPFVLGDPDALTALFTEAGIPTAAITTRDGEAHFPSIRTMVEADLRGWLPVMGVVLPEEQISEILRRADAALARHAAPDGQVTFSLSAHIVTAVND